MIVRKADDYKYTQVGVDIGNFSIKVAAIRKQLMGRRGILSFGIEHIPKDASLEQKAEVLRKTMQAARITAEKVNISVCGPNVICRYIRLPIMRRYELGKSLQLGWDNYISLKIDEVVWDYTLLGTFRDSLGHKYMQVLLVAAKKNFIEERMRLLSVAGLEVESIYVDALALAKAFKFTQSFNNQQPIVLLNAGEYFTNVAVLKKGICWFSRDIPIGGRDITQILMEKLHLAWPEAEKLKYNPDKQDPKISTPVRTVLDNLVNELRLSFEYLARELEGEMQFIYISGGSAHAFQLDEFLSKNLNIPARKWNPVVAFKLGPGFSQEALEKYSPDLTVAIGLALVKRKKNYNLWELENFLS